MGKLVYRGTNISTTLTGRAFMWVGVWTFAMGSNYNGCFGEPSDRSLLATRRSTLGRCMRKLHQFLRAACTFWKERIGCHTQRYLVPRKRAAHRDHSDLEHLS
jgi:hypothetical protein